ncbi:MAG: CpaD family pilus assembly protein [Sphingomicrobium sp.]
MRSKLCIALLASALGACGYTPHDLPARGLAAVNAPVVERADYTVDLAAPGGTLLPGEAERLNGWFSGLALGYGDTIYVDGGYSDAARTQVAQVASRYGMLVQSGAPITPGALADGTVRVVVSRNRASVPNCPNWSVPAQPNFQNQSYSNLGCGVNANMAAMVANPEDLVHGREGSSVVDAQTATKAISTYRSALPTGREGLKDINTKESK